MGSEPCQPLTIAEIRSVRDEMKQKSDVQQRGLKICGDMKLFFFFMLTNI